MTPTVSVIVPVRDRRALLGELLAALDNQEQDDFEVIVVDDGSTDGSDHLATSSTVRGRPVRLVRSPGRGAVQARIAGVDAARGSILAFTDSDCRPDPGWLTAGIAAIEAGADVVNGLTLPERLVGPLERSVWSGEEALYPTCNVLYRREAYDAAGGFDVDAGRRWGFRFTDRARGLGFAEDTLLAWNVRRTGVAVHVPDALVVHHVFGADLREWLRRGVMLGSFPAIIRELPELRPTLLPRSVLFHQYSRVPLYVAAALAILGRRRLAALGGPAWALLKLRELRRARIPMAEAVRALPALLVVDVVNAAALAAGSLRARTVVL